MKSKAIISLFETVRLSVSISPRNLYNSLKSIKESVVFRHPRNFQVSEYVVSVKFSSIFIIGLIRDLFVSCVDSLME